MVIRSGPVSEEAVATCNILNVLKEMGVDNESLGKLFIFLNDDEKTVELFSECSNKDRSLLHDWAEELGLEHTSDGPKNARILTVTKNPNFRLQSLNNCSLILIFIIYQLHEIDCVTLVKEQYYYDGYIGLRGPLVDLAARTGIDAVPTNYIKNRVNRDGTENHITIISRKELQQIIPKGSKSPSAKSILQEMNEVLLISLLDGSFLKKNFCPSHFSIRGKI